jgi:hypothetical protein
MSFSDYGHICPGQTAPTAFLGTDAQVADALTEKFNEYFTYHKSHERVRRNERKTKKIILGLLEAYIKDHGNSAYADSQLIHAALDTQVLGRNILKNATIFEFYRFSELHFDAPLIGVDKSIASNKFNYSQVIDLLKVSLDRISTVFEASIPEILALDGVLRYDLVQAVGEINKQVKDLFSVLNQEHMTEDHQLPTPKTITQY